MARLKPPPWWLVLIQAVMAILPPVLDAVIREEPDEDSTAISVRSLEGAGNVEIFAIPVKKGQLPGV
jgi:hypothetical protein